MSRGSGGVVTTSTTVSEVPRSSGVPRAVKVCAMGGTCVCEAASWLGLAAAPTFAIMALGAALSSGQATMLNMGMPHASSLSGAVLMYTLMSIFHTGPWLRRIARRSTHPDRQCPR